jgi:hypothetical protein
MNFENLLKLSLNFGSSRALLKQPALNLYQLSLSLAYDCCTSRFLVSTCPLPKLSNQKVFTSDNRSSSSTPFVEGSALAEKQDDDQCHILCFSNATGEIRQCFLGEIAAISAFLIHLELYLLLLESGKWKYKLASVKVANLLLKKRINSIVRDAYELQRPIRNKWRVEKVQRFMCPPRHIQPTVFRQI